jgi:8-oxo-dGTP pyrophosphatase MutT (NUDIX family)
MAEKELRLVSKPGATAMIVNRGSVLILKRIRLPFIINPGRWFFVGGAMKRGESPLETAYREIMEETGIEAAELALLSSSTTTVADVGKGLKWPNSLFVFESKTRKVRLNIEHTDYRWVPLSGLGEYPDLEQSLRGYRAVLGRAAKPGPQGRRALGKDRAGRR